VDKEVINTVDRLEFRKDLNLLRALSVVSVIIYHINKDFLPGGWLGVDIFFFISGYLISNKIIIELKNSNFKFRNFYIKRIKRILPALFSSLIFTIPFAYLLLPPKELYLYLSSFQSTLLFYSNIFFQNLDFYNSPSSKFFPLLHMWSLSIEEQFYIIFPLILFLIYKYKKNKIFVLLSTIAIISLIINIFDFGNIIFYQLQFRIWEFLFGVIFMFLDKSLKFKKSTKHLGLFLIFFSFIFFNDGMLNYVYTKLICLIGVFLYLVKSHENKFIKELNNNKIVQQIGLISFSLYLFHQPIFVFFRIYDNKVSDLSSFSYIPLVIFLYTISYLNWKYVEVPYQRNFVKKKKIILGSLFIFMTLSTFTLLNDDSFINKFTNIPSKVLLLSFKNQDTISQNGISCDNRTVEDTCVFEVPDAKKDIYVIGDSSLRTLSTALLELQEEKKYNLIHLGGDDCMYLLGSKLSENSCPNKDIREMDNFVKNIKDSVIIYGGRIPRYLTGTGFDNSFEAEDNNIAVIDNFDIKLIETINLLSLNNTVVLLYPIPEQGWNVPELYFYKKFEWGETVAYPSSIWYERVKKSNILLDNADGSTLLRVFPEKIFCDSYLNKYCVGAIEDKIFYSDDDHLSLEGSRLLAVEILKKIKLDQ
tara:strand:- start:1143 stop:3077 length:1935 start_codon:yes stop_codon:yes gene_type:complete